MEAQVRTKWIALLTVASLTQVPGLVAQEPNLAFVSPEVVLTQPVPGEKSPFLAGALSGLLFPGLGSFYAGNSGHGVRHVAIAGVALVGFIVGGFDDDCEVLGDGSGCTLLFTSFGVYVVNWGWSIVVGVSDANDYNRSLNTAGLQIAPQLIAVRSEGRNTGRPAVETLRSLRARYSG